MSWEGSDKWYSGIVGEKGHHYHQTVLLPNLLRLLSLQKGESLLDIGCGQGVLSRQIPAGVEYWGIDSSPSLIKEAKQLTKREAHFFTADASQKFPFEKRDFNAVCFLLSLQNMEFPERAVANAAAHLKKGGRLAIVLNHPCFRIPRQSEWGIDEKRKLQYRRINRYMTPEKIPIQTHPGKGEKSELTYSYHSPLSSFSQFLAEANCTILSIEEWCSDKNSVGAKAKMEDRARREIPLFLSILARKDNNV